MLRRMAGDDRAAGRNVHAVGGKSGKRTREDSHRACATIRRAAVEDKAALVLDTSSCYYIFFHSTEADNVMLSAFSLPDLRRYAC